MKLKPAQALLLRRLDARLPVLAVAMTAWLKSKSAAFSYKGGGDAPLAISAPHHPSSVAR